jgi:hypothetical protein
VTSGISRSADARSFRGAHRGRVCVHVFIGVSVRVCCERLCYTVSFLKKVAKKRSGRCTSKATCKSTTIFFLLSLLPRSTIATHKKSQPDGPKVRREHEWRWASSSSLPVRAPSSASLDAGLDLTVDPSPCSRSQPPRSGSEGGRERIEAMWPRGGVNRPAHRI